MTLYRLYCGGSKIRQRFRLKWLSYIIAFTPKEDKTAEVKAPERGEKSSIMDRLKSAKAEKQKECCPPKKHKGEIEL